jgi:NAD-dependent SIR2 family protein deacetylase
MLYRDFVSSAANRRRYWARSMVGWERIARARPNPAHHALARLETTGRLLHLITQNVDSLHQRSGSRRVLDLHGRLDRVECLACRMLFQRHAFQEELRRLNPTWHAGVDTERITPDGDAELAGADYDAFRLPGCPCCGGDLKPWVVFFGESVPRGRTRRALELLEEADALLVVGSSLMVWSGYRFARKAAADGKPVALVNLGTTRADGEATLKVAGRCAEVLPELLERLGDPLSGDGRRDARRL